MYSIPKKSILFILYSLLPLSFAFGQVPKTYPAGELQLALKKLNTVGTALYIAAHPDDENTAMLSYLAKERLVRAAYLAITRGDGGQNLIGSEQAELMGLIRTQELLQARRTDGAEQFFTRANDFGFSKSTEEALEIWGKEEVLSDVVWTIRKLKPDVIITRFPPNSMAGHGHHSASAVLAEEAFVAAADPKRFPEQLKFVQPWQAKRVVWNSYSPGFTNKPPDTLDYVAVNLGAYNTLLGKSYTEIAAESRSMHKSQGFGSARGRGERIDYLRHKAGVPAKNDLFDGVDLSWNRIKGGDQVSQLLQRAYGTFKPEKPEASLPLLLQAYGQLEKLPSDNYWVGVKKKELEEVIVGALGLWYEVNGTTYAVSPGDSLKVNTSVVKRADFPVTVKSIQFKGVSKDTVVNKPLKYNELLTNTFTLRLPEDIAVTQPYWLVNPPLKGMYEVADRQLIGKPEKEPQLAVQFNLEIGGVPFSFVRPIDYKWTDPVEGELYRPLEIRPQVMANITENVYVFPSKEAKTVQVLLKSGMDSVSGVVSLDLPKNWQAKPQFIPFTFTKTNEEQKVAFEVIPPANTEVGRMKALIKTSTGKTLSKGILTINYPHIPIQTIYPEAEAKVVRLEVQTAGKNIAYIMGAGDDVPAALRQIGYQVTVLSENDLKKDNYLNQFDAIVTGIRAYNTVDRLPFYQGNLMEYVKNGGTLVVQYNTNRGLVTEPIGPYRFEISRNRVTAEDAPIKFPNPKHPLLNTPNKITQKDFENWVQERGLYFADKWDSTHYQPVLSSHDLGEKPQEGGLLVAPYGKGKFIYTGYAFFRQLPAGVPGAYRLFANLLSGDNKL